MTWTVLAHTQKVMTGLPTTAIDTTGADLLIIGISTANGTLATPTDSKGNTWTQAVTLGASGRGAGQILYSRPTSVGTGHTFTETGGNVGVLSVIAVSGSVASPLDQTNSHTFANDSVTTTRTTGSVTPTQNGELCIAIYEIDDPAGSTFSIDSGFTISDSFDVVVGATFGLVTSYFAQGTAAAVNPTLTRSVAGTSGHSEVAMIATFKGVAPSGSVGSASGSGAATGVGASLASAVGTATGVGSAAGVGASLAAGVGSAAGVSTVTGVGKSLAASVGSAAGVSTVLGVGSFTSSAGVGTAAGVSTVNGVGSFRAIISAIGSAGGFATVHGVDGSIYPVTVGVYRALTDLYLPDGTYIEAGTTFTGPNGWIPSVGVDPIDTNAIQSYWNLGPVTMDNAENSICLFPWGDWMRRSGVIVMPPKVAWKPATGGGYILTGDGAALGPRYP